MGCRIKGQGEEGAKGQGKKPTNIALLCNKVKLTITQPRPQVFLVNGILTCKKAVFLTSSVY